jgi:diacylglycerol kinase (ATP)
MASAAKHRVLVIWNPSAGGAQKHSELRDALEHEPGVTVRATGSRDEAIDAVTDAASHGVSRVIAAGGDGTVNAVVTALYQLPAPDRKRIALAVCPLGTGNDLARSLGMPLEPAAALEECLERPEEDLDVIVVDSGKDRRIVANMVTGGNTGKYTSLLSDEMKQRWGPFCYLRGALDVLSELDVYDVQLHCDNDPPVHCSALNLFIANGRTSGGGMVVSPDARLDDGLFDLLVIQDGSAFDLATLTVNYLLTDYRQHDLILYRRCRRLTLQSTPPVPLSTDGDPVDSGSFSISTEARALRAVRGTGSIDND